MTTQSYKNISKKQFVGDNRVTLDAKHKEMMNYFRELKKSLPIKKKRYIDAQEELSSLEKIENSKLSKDQLDQKFFLTEELKNLNQEIDDIESNKEENDYFLNTASLLYIYYENLEKTANEKEDIPIQKKTSSSSNINENIDENSPTITDFFGGNPVKKNLSSNRSSKLTSTKMDEYFQTEDKFMRADILDKFMKKIDPTYFNKHLYEENINLCDTCKIERTLIRSEGIILCEQCLEVEYVVVCSEKPSPKDKPCGDSYYAYKRSNHFAEWLSQIQAKESTEISQDVFDLILFEIKKERIKDMSKITPEKMRQYLKKLKLNKYYEHIPYIIYRLNGIKPPTFSKELEEKLRFMFKEIQQPFEEVCPSKRKNFLSYSYVLYKFFELLGLDNYKKQFSLLKSRTKLHEQDKIWRDICKITKWQYIPSI
jgi:hypothetical protein